MMLLVIKRILEDIKQSSSKIREYYQSSYEEAKQREVFLNYEKKKQKLWNNWLMKVEETAEEASKISKEAAKSRGSSPCCFRSC